MPVKPTPLTTSITLAATLLLLPGTIARAADYHVGDGQTYASIGAVPWESLQPGDTVYIHWRSTPYKEKFVIGRQGTQLAPITVSGVPGPGGQLPVIDGNNATTRLQLDYWSETRGVIKIGGSSVPPDAMPQYIVVENLDVRSARPPYTFTDDGGAVQSYPNNAAALYLEKGEHVTIRNCILQDSGNGLFVASSDDAPSRDILIDANHIHDNGIVGDNFVHNTYTAAIGITYQFNRMGPLRAGAGGNNLKDRSAGLVVRYNWIEGGNRQLDLVEGDDSGQIVSDPTYRETFAYGNVLIEYDGGGNSQILHYGGDNGTTSLYRKGTLYFYNNTVVSMRGGNTTLMRLSTNDEHADARNNVVYVTAAGSRLAMLDETGVLSLTHNWFKPGWVASHGTLAGTINDDGTSILGASPGFFDESSMNYRLASASDCVDAAASLHPDVLPDHALDMQYVPHQSGASRVPAGTGLDLGAFELPLQPGDFDDDGDVDLDDFAVYQACSTGPAAPQTDPDCLPTDLDGDGDTDQSDFGVFQRCISGPTLPADPACAN